MPRRALAAVSVTSRERLEPSRLKLHVGQNRADLSPKFPYEPLNHGSLKCQLSTNKSEGKLHPIDINPFLQAFYQGLPCGFMGNGLSMPCGAEFHKQEMCGSA